MQIEQHEGGAPIHKEIGSKALISTIIFVLHGRCYSLLQTSNYMKLKMTFKLISWKSLFSLTKKKGRENQHLLVWTVGICLYDTTLNLRAFIIFLWFGAKFVTNHDSQRCSIHEYVDNNTDRAHNQLTVFQGNFPHDTNGHNNISHNYHESCPTNLLLQRQKHNNTTTGSWRTPICKKEFKNKKIPLFLI